MINNVVLRLCSRDEPARNCDGVAALSPPAAGDAGDAGPETAHEIAAAVGSGALGARQAVERSLARIEALDPEINSCVEVLERAALERADEIDRGGEDPARRPLLGVPVTVKEIIEVRGARNTWGCPAFADRRASADDPYVARLREAGAIVVATTNVPELSCWGHTENPVYGPTLNPRDPRRTPGGSSGGAAASVALAIAPLAIGSDAGGSIRIPASFSGVVGFKPSFEATPADATAGVNRLNVVGPLAARVADARLAAAALSQGRIGAPGAPGPGSARLAVSEDHGFAPVEPEVRVGFRRAIAELEAAGWELARADPAPDEGGRSPLGFIVPPLECEVYEAFAEVLEGGEHGLSAATVAIAEIGLRTSGRDYFRCLRERSAYEREWRRFFAGHDLLLAPTTQLPAFELGRNGPDAIDGEPVDPDADGSWYPTSFVANVIGAPALSLPCGATDAGLPIGLQVMGPPGADDLVLATGEAIERLLRPRAPAGR